MIRTTLLELIDTVSPYAATEADLLAAVVNLVNSGMVVLTGNFRGQTFRMDDLALRA